MSSYKSSEAEYDKIFLSNLYYDLQMNGLEISNANIKKLLTHPGFIKNSAAFNLASSSNLPDFKSFSVASIAAL